MTLDQALNAEFLLTRTTMAYPDFAEGVRAMVVDKDRQPKWQPARIEDVDVVQADPAEDADEGIESRPTEVAPPDQREEGEHARERVRDDVKVRRPQVLVPV